MRNQNQDFGYLKSHPRKATFNRFELTVAMIFSFLVGAGLMAAASILLMAL